MNQEREKLTQHQITGLAVASTMLLLPLLITLRMGVTQAPRMKVASDRDTEAIERRFAASIKFRPTAIPQNIAMIVAGTSGQFTRTGTSCTEPEGPHWAIYHSPYHPVYFNAEASPRGFSIDSDGKVFVPRGASPGLYSGAVLSGGNACGARTDHVTQFSFVVTASPSD